MTAPGNGPTLWPRFCYGAGQGPGKLDEVRHFNFPPLTRKIIARPTVKHALLDDKLMALEQARTWSPRVVSRLEQSILYGSDEDLFRVNPVQFAADKGIEEEEAIDLFLHAAHLGIFDLHWNVICQTCGNVMSSFRTLATLHPHAICNHCWYENESSLDDLIQISFTVSAGIREIAYHRPDSLSIEDYYYRYHLSNGVTMAEGMPDFHDVYRALLVIGLAYIDPGESKSFLLQPKPSAVSVGDVFSDAGAIFLVSEEQETEPASMSIVAKDGQFHFPARELAPMDYPSGPSAFRFKQAGHLLSGKLKIEVKNHEEQRIGLYIRQHPEDPERYHLRARPALTGKRLLTNQTFRDLFRTERAPADEGIGVEDISLLFTDLKGSTAIYEHVGDLNAYHLVRQHFETLRQVVAQNRGAVVKTIGDAVMAAFSEPTDAVRAAADMLETIAEFNRGSGADDLVLKIGVHRGPSIVVTLNGRIDYFGQTVNVASRVQGLAGAGEVYVSGEVYETEGVAALLDAWNVTAEEVSVKGVVGTLKVFRISTGENAR